MSLLLTTDRNQFYWEARLHRSSQLPRASVHLVVPGCAHMCVRVCRHPRTFRGCAADRYVVGGESADISAGLGHSLTLDLSL